MTWVLLIFVYLGGPAMVVVPGYATKDACHDAGDEVLASQEARARDHVGFVCFPGPEARRD